MTTTAFETVVDRTLASARRTPDRIMYRFFDGKGRVEQSYTCGQMVAAMKSMSGYLTQVCGLAPGDRALLVYPPSLDFAVALLGCMHAGVVPAPVYPPNPFKLEEGLETFRPITENCGARVALTNRTYARSRRIGQVRSFVKRSAGLPDHLKWISTDKVRPGKYEGVRGPAAGPDDLALLQYTSGSTSAPKGVMITHGNLIHQLAFNRDELGLDGESHSITWVPQYHDFGLISGILSIAAGNGTLGLFSPLSFIERPAVWLEILERYEATHTAAPNFAYELAVRKTTAEQRAGWDLSRLVVAMSAAEPVRSSTIRRFREAFAVSGFRPEAVVPAYGLAEHTVGVTVAGTRQVVVDRAALDRQRVVEAAADDPNPLTLVGCGAPTGDIEVRIVDPESRVALGENQVGEIWCDSPSKAAGYLGQPELTTETFEARLADGSERGWLRTGDMGFLHGGELFVCGRLKDMLILQGRNLYPQDVEDSARGAHPLVRPGGLAAFVIDHVGDATPDELVLYVELRGARPSPAVTREVAVAVQKAVRDGCDVSCSRIVIGGVGLVLKTTSGKIRRRACKAQWRAGGGPNVWSVEAFDRDPTDSPAPAASAFSAPKDDGLPLDRFIHLHATEVLGLSGPDELDPQRPLFVQGLSSLLAVDLCNRVSERVGREIPMTLLFQHPSVEAFTAAILDEEGHGAGAQGVVGDAALNLGAGDRVVVIGGGPAGITTAVELVAKGASVLLVEREARIGGKVATGYVDGRSYELGQLLFFPSYSRVLGRVAALGLELMAGHVKNHAQSNDGEAEPLANSETIAWCHDALEKAGHHFEMSTALADVPPELTVPIQEWITSVGLRTPPVGLMDLLTGFGYGHLESQVPAAYVLGLCAMFAETNLHIALLDGENVDLWEAEVARLHASGAFEVLSGTAVSRVGRSGTGGVKVDLADGRTIEGDAAVIATPPDVACAILDPAHPALPLLKKYQTFEYVVTVADIHAPQWPNHGTLFENLGLDRSGHVMDFQRQYDDFDVLTLSQYGFGPDGERWSDDDLHRMLAEDVAAGGGTLGEVHVRRRWVYFPHMPPADLRAGALEALGALQGHDGIMFAGSFLNLETLEHTVAHTQDLIRSRVSVVGDATGFEDVLADPVLGPFAETALDPRAADASLTVGEWVVRPAHAGDWPEIDRLDQEEYGWLGEDAVEGSESIKHQIALLNGGDEPWLWVLERGGLMVSWYVLQPTRKAPGTFTSWADATDDGRLTGTFDPSGDNVYLVAGGLSANQPKAAHQLMVINTLRLLRDRRKTSVFCCLSMPGFAQAHALTGIEPEDYMRQRRPDGVPVDPMLAVFHDLWPGVHHPPRLLINGYPPDTFSGGHGVSSIFEMADPQEEIRQMLVKLAANRAPLDI